MWNFMTLASQCSWAGRFESYLVENPYDRFSRDVALIKQMLKMNLQPYLISISYCKYTQLDDLPLYWSAYKGLSIIAYQVLHVGQYCIAHVYVFLACIQRDIYPMYHLWAHVSFQSEKKKKKKLKYHSIKWITFETTWKSWNDPPQDTTNKMTCAPSQDSDQPWHPPSLIIALMSTQWIAKDPRFLHGDREDSDQTVQMPRLILVFAGCTCHFVGFVMWQLIYFWDFRAMPSWQNTVNLVFFTCIWAMSCENVSYAICEQQWCRSACASAQSDQHLCCSLPR